MTQRFEKLKTLLKELFQLDQPDLDFGLYRIMHAKAAEVTQFLDKDLLPQVRKAFEQYQPADKAELEKDLAKAIEQAQALGADPETLPKVKDLRRKLAEDAVDIGGLEDEVYDHLFSFFRRYYSEGDFLAKRVYKPGVYAIPYEGEEVKLHWANRDQYYIKTSEYLRDYAFRLRPENEANPMRVHFRLVDAAEGEHGNVKAAEGKDRVFILAAEDCVAQENDDLVIRFEYRPATLADWHPAPGRGTLGRGTLQRAPATTDPGTGTDLGTGTLGTGTLQRAPTTTDPGTGIDPGTGTDLGTGIDLGRGTLRRAPTAESHSPTSADQREAKTKPPAQKDLIAIAATRVLAVADASLAAWIAELGKPHTLSSGEKADYSRLEAHLRRYTARNTFDYFIHKDLGGFLRRELDFYIKNEVMHLDDIENETAPRVEQYLSKIKVIRRIAGKIIDFLAQLEDFQKKLWLKKKFVVETNYCITLDRIPEEFYPEIAANDAQRKEWVRLFAIDEIKGDLATPGYKVPLTVAFLKGHPTLVLDTRHFDADFTARLLQAIGDVREQTDGMLVRSENFQALSLAQARYGEQVKCIYIDPPYNTDASAILYKNDYKHSSWMSLIENRLALTGRLLGTTGVICFAVDDEEVSEARHVLAQFFPKEVGIAVVRSNPQSRKAKGTFSPAHEYALFYGRSSTSTPGSLELTEKRMARYPKQDEKGRFAWMNFIRTGTNDRRADRPKLYYPILVAHDNTLRIPNMTWSSELGEYGEYVLNEPIRENEVAVFPVVDTDEGQIEKRWHRGHGRVTEEPDEYRARRDPDGHVSIDFKTRMDESSTPVTWWDSKEYASANYGAVELKALFGAKPFDFPKALGLVADCLRAANANADSIVLDYFAGSGTTGHAVLNLNREDGGRRKFILVEMGDYFDTVLLPRIKKVTFTPEWKDGKPKRLATKEEAERSPRIVKIIRLESYEDALNNLETRRTDTQRSLLEAPGARGADGLKEQYLLRYMLDVETRGSQSLLNVQAFKDPTAYKLKVKRPGSDESREVSVDLLETFNYLNYLIGLTVQHIAAPQTFSASFKRDDDPDLPADAPRRLLLDGRLKEISPHPTPLPASGAREEKVWWFRTVTGTTPDGRRTLIMWRKLTGDPEQDNLVLDAWFTKQGYSTKDYEFHLIYVNGDNNLENLKQPDDTWKVRMIEEDFHRLMFDTEGV